MKIDVIIIKNNENNSFVNVTYNLYVYPMNSDMLKAQNFIGV